MRNDVKTLIAALTTERNSLDRAIAALKAMSDAREPEPAPVKRGRGRQKGEKLSAAHRASLSAAMKARWARARGEDVTHGDNSATAPEKQWESAPTPELAGALQ